MISYELLVSITLKELRIAKLGFFKFFIGIWGTFMMSTSYPYSLSFVASIFACPPIPPLYRGDMKSSFTIGKYFVVLKRYTIYIICLSNKSVKMDSASEKSIASLVLFGIFFSYN